ncbi:hypothetical protein EXIGLDRAFT_692762 [Exidia glandulosa HHB12029]|uniref:Uncharacterized protein n=1 Tax=Exidia glandulosa HHB12029 TaxID=1314781 RepID=A0A165YZF9_EXIGL|nr:hypothetical protein EXIGLDRAFT_692762 [Exidia glandulosa HHB12029]
MIATRWGEHVSAVATSGRWCGRFGRMNNPRPLGVEGDKLSLSPWSERRFRRAGAGVTKTAFARSGQTARSSQKWEHRRHFRLFMARTGQARTLSQVGETTTLEISGCMYSEVIGVKEHVAVNAGNETGAPSAGHISKPRTMSVGDESARIEEHDEAMAHWAQYDEQDDVQLEDGMQPEEDD